MPPRQKVTSHAHDRPAEFDARLLSYKPGMHNLARKLTARHHARFKTPEARADLVTDTIAYCLDNWCNYREDGGWWNWIYWAMRGVLKADMDRTNIRRGIEPVHNELRYEQAATPATQHDYTELSDVLSRLTGGRDSEALLRTAMGDQLHEIGADMGISRERVRQLVERERAVLRKRTGRFEREVA